MILIFSISTDSTTTEVVDWLKAFDPNISIVRINNDLQDVKFKQMIYTHNEKSLWVQTSQGELIDLFKAKVVWYRKGGCMVRNTFTNGNDTAFPPGYVKYHLHQEMSTLSDFIYATIENRAYYSLGSYKKGNLNKLLTLRLANTLGIKTPDYWVVTSKKEIQEILKQNELVTKSISEGVYLTNKDHAYYTYTEKISKEIANNFSEEFFPSLVQKNIQKKIEIRSFYLEGKFYSMAIFSQKNNQTSIDFRKYDSQIPNRTIPYKLPVWVEKQLTSLFHKLGLNTGSVDLILTPNEEYVFLEINPVGQFGMVSYPCNYYLEKEVAKLLYEKWKETF